MTSSKVGPAVLTVGLGTLIAVQSRVNGQLAVHTGTGFMPAWWTMTTGVVILAVFARLHRPTRTAVGQLQPALRDRRLPAWALIGGVFGSLFLITQSIIVPLAGVAVFSVGTVAGQTTGSLLVDRWGISASGVVHVTVNRVVAAVLAVAAVVIAISDRLASTPGSLAFAVFAFLAGAVIAPQQAANGRVAVTSGSPFAAAFVNFLGGFLLMSLTVGFVVITGLVAIHDPWGAPWWSYLGGLLGLSVIAGAAWVVPVLGVLVFSLLSVFGQLVGALLLDLTVPTPGTTVGWHLFAGVALTFVAIVIAGLRRT